MYCCVCDLRNGCREVCDWLGVHLGGIEVSRREVLLSELGISDADDFDSGVMEDWPMGVGDGYTTRQLVVVKYFRFREGIRDIADQLGVSRSRVSRIVNESFRKLGV